MRAGRLSPLPAWVEAVGRVGPWVGCWCGAPCRLPPGGGPTCLLCLLSPRSFLQLGAGLSVGLSGLAAGFAIGIVGDAGVRGTAQQPRLFVGMILILIFAEVLGLYGLIVALILSTK